MDAGVPENLLNTCRGFTDRALRDIGDTWDATVISRCTAGME